MNDITVEEALLMSIAVGESDKDAVVSHTAELLGVKPANDVVVRAHLNRILDRGWLDIAGGRMQVTDSGRKAVRQLRQRMRMAEFRTMTF